MVGGGKFTFANYQFDATASGEDVRMVNIPLAYYTQYAATNLTTCQLFDGATVLNTGSNIKNPSAISSSTVFTFDGSGLVIPKGTVKTISLQCNSAATSTATYLWGIDADATWTDLAAGMTSGQSFTPTVSADNGGQLITLSTGGTLTVALDNSSPSYKIAAAGSTGNTVSVLKFHAANEAVSLQKVSLMLSSAASNSPQDLTQVTLWDGSTQVGTAIFTSTNYATSTLTTPVLIPKDGDKVLTVKVDLANIGTSLPGTEGALVKVDYNDDDSTGTSGTGQNSGTTVDRTSSASTASNGIRVFKSYPTFAQIPLTTNEKVLATGTYLPLYKFSVTASPASANGIGLHAFNINIATATASSVGGTTTVTNIRVYAYTDSGFSSVVGQGFTNGIVASTTDTLAGGLVSSGNTVATTTNANGTATIVQIPAGSTIYFKVTGDITFTTGTSPSGWVRTYIAGDAAYPAPAGVTIEVSTANAVSGSKVLWTPNATTTSGTGNQDWTNGYNVSGIPSSGMNSEMISK
ncbi:MAG: Large surface exposed glycoprotein PsrP [Parcubacteria group bacterium Athens0714_24]|nr:MAG: Large surface exposed glycoprotein PsrP [Parcubacteria group bacterium Athens0714_24]